MVKKTKCDLPKGKGGINYVDLLALAKARNLAIPKRILKRDLCKLVNNENSMSFHTAVTEYPPTLQTAVTEKMETVKTAKDESNLPNLADLYDVDEMIGAGSFGSVWSAIDRKTGEKVALKLLHSLSDDSRREVAILVNLSKIYNGACSKNIICYKDQFAAMYSPFGENRRFEVIVTEFVNGVSLDHWLANHGTPSKVILKKWERQLSGALDLCHLNEISHLDVKPSNVMIRKITNDLVLIDFGVSCIAGVPTSKPSSCKGVTGAGTYVYMSPEYIEQCVVNQKDCNEGVRERTDFWAAALTILNAETSDFYQDAMIAAIEKFPKSVTSADWHSYISWLKKFVKDNPPDTGDKDLDRKLEKFLDDAM